AAGHAPHAAHVGADRLSDLARRLAYCVREVGRRGERLHDGEGRLRLPEPLCGRLIEPGLVGCRGGLRGERGREPDPWLGARAPRPCCRLSPTAVRLWWTSGTIRAVRAWKSLSHDSVCSLPSADSTAGCCCSTTSTTARGTVSRARLEAPSRRPCVRSLAASA